MRTYLPLFARSRRMAAALVAVVAFACSAEPFALEATGPFSYPAVVDPRLERVAILVTITSRSGDDLLINPADFVARDQDHRVYPANPAATVADAHLVTRAGALLGMGGILPLPSVTLREDDVLSGFVVFDVPANRHLVELIWRQSDTDHVATLPSAR